MDTYTQGWNAFMNGCGREDPDVFCDEPLTPTERARWLEGWDAAFKTANGYAAPE